MKRPSAFWSLLVLLFLSGTTGWARVHHELAVRLQPDQSHLSVSDQIRWQVPVREIEIQLHEGLQLVLRTPGAILQRIRPIEQLPGRPPIARYRVRMPTESTTLALEYTGKIHHPVERDETPGIISGDGVHLSGESSWVPQISGHELLTFDLTITAPEPYRWMSQGDLLADIELGTERVTRFRSGDPQQEIHLEGAAFHQYGARAGQTEISALLRSEDAALAQRYLDATGPFIELYSRLLGPYPYSKFAMVENFFETGYGMPSYTLLGPSVIRLPFLLQSSYPHEILHNWWGNSVYVDGATGNWCEGLTSYLADHLLQEQSGAGATHRREILQKFTNFVTPSNDFPLSRFRSRFDDASSAIGYGKAAMFFHMLRTMLGDEPFVRGLRSFYAGHRFQKADYADLKDAFSRETPGLDLSFEFRQWTERTGAPQLRIEEASSRPEGTMHRLRVRISQIQAEAPFLIRVPVAIHLEGRAEAVQTTVSLKSDEGRIGEFTFQLPARPVRVDVDPEFDVFRRLSPEESPPSVSQLLGAPHVVILIPSAAPPSQQAGYLALATAIQKDSSGQVEIRRDDELSTLPANSTAWILGAENRFAARGASAIAPYGVSVSSTEVTGLASGFSRSDRSFVFTADRSGWIVMDPAHGQEAFLALGRKLRHYGKFSHAVFESSRATNTLRGEWPILDSPLSAYVKQEDGAATQPHRGSLAKRRPLSGT
jgi:hypothetical protein